MAAVGHIEVREAHSPVADHRDAARLERLERCTHITDRLGPGTDQHEGAPAQFVQIGGDVPPRRRPGPVPPGGAAPPGPAPPRPPPPRRPRVAGPRTPSGCATASVADTVVPPLA